MRTFSQCQLYTFVDTGYLDGRSPVLLAQQLCDGGSDVIQLRAKDAPLDEVRRMAEAILPITNRAGIPLVINDHWQLALDLNSPACHLGQEDFFDSGYTQRSQLIAGDKRLQLGLSSHAPAQAARAVAAGADYIAIGPVYPTGTKPTAKPVTLEYVRWAKANVTIPWFAIGGINLQTIDDVIEAGARRICVVSAILRAPDVAKACLEFKKRLSSAL